MKATQPWQGLSQMRRWEVLQQAIGRGHAEDVAELMGLSPEQVRRWMREPFGEESPTSTGQKSPLDRFCEMFQAVCAVNPDGADLLIDYLRDLRRKLRGDDVRPMTQAEVGEAVREIRGVLNKLLLQMTQEPEKQPTKFQTVG